jgi:hypothetical protein
MSSKNPIDSLFKQELKEHQIQPSAAAWERIAAAQQGSSKKNGAVFLWRAASISLLIGLSSVFHFNRNLKDLGLDTPLEAATAFVVEYEVASPVTPENNREEPKQNVQKQDPKKGNSSSPKTAKKSQKNAGSKARKSSSRVIPLLQQRMPDPILAFNDLMPVSGGFDLEETEVIPDPGVYRVRVDLPNLRGNYETNPTQKTRPFSERMWAYASDQFERVKAGESLELPKTDDATIEIPLPDFINRRFAK